MELSPTQLAALQTFTITSAKLRTDNLSVGQQILAKVISLNSTTGEITLNINNTLLNAKTTLPLKTDQILQLLVAQTGKQITLKLPEKLINSLITEQAMRQILPQQKPIGFAIQKIQQFIKHAKTLEIPPRLIQITSNFTKQLPTIKQLSTAEGVKTAIQNSGLLLEKNLKEILNNSMPTNIKKDLKSLFIDLRNSLEKEQITKTYPTTTQPLSSKQPLAQTSIKANLSQSTLPNQINNLEQAKTSRHPATAQVTSQVITTPHNMRQADVTKAVENVKQPSNSTQAEYVTKIISQQFKATPNTLTKLALQTPSPIQTHTLLSPHTANTGSPYGRETNAIKQALDFAATKIDSTQTKTAARIISLVDMVENLVKSVDSAISRTQLHQLHSLQEQDNGKLTWSLEIPVQDDDEIHLIQMQYEKEQAADQDGDAVVTVNLAIELETLGPVHARITLIRENIGVVLSAEKDETYKLTRHHVITLEENLHKSGFNTENIACHQGKPPQSRSSETANGNNLVDVKA